MFQYYNWEEVNINWELVDMNWEEVGILINDVLPYISTSGGVSGKHTIKLKPLNKLPEDKKRVIIKLCYALAKSFDNQYYLRRNKV
jgi:hypothetical protein